MTERVLVKCFTAGGILLILSMFANLVNTVNSYDSYVENNSHIISAFNG